MIKTDIVSNNVLRITAPEKLNVISRGTRMNVRSR